MKNVVFKYLNGNATEPELQNLVEWMRFSANRKLFNQYKTEWQEELAQEKSKIPDGWNNLEIKLSQRIFEKWQNSRRGYRNFQYAAIFLLITLTAGTAAYFSNENKTVKQTYTRVTAGNGHIAEVELPDGSLVWLNSGSKISYNNLFAQNNREIGLTGEAFVKAATKKSIPMVVSCGGLQVKVTGTRFNVSSYPLQHTVEVTLEEGEVELANAETGDIFYRLNPGQRVVYDTANKEFLVNNVNTSRYTSWKEGIINIYDQPLEEVVKRLENRYNQKFLVNPSVKNYRYTFTIKNEPLDEIIGLMEKITPVKAIQKNVVIEFQPDKMKLKSVGG